MHLHRCPRCGVAYRCATMERDEHRARCVPRCWGCDEPTRTEASGTGVTPALTHADR